MLEIVQSWFDWLSGLPQEVWAVTLGLLVAISVTQLVKVVVPWERLPEGRRVPVIRLVALVIGFAAVWTLWPAGPWRVWLALFVGSANPMVYRLGVAVVRRRFPKVAQALSHDGD